MHGFVHLLPLEHSTLSVSAVARAASALSQPDLAPKGFLLNRRLSSSRPHPWPTRFCLTDVESPPCSPEETILFLDVATRHKMAVPILKNRTGDSDSVAAQTLGWLPSRHRKPLRLAIIAMLIVLMVSNWSRSPVAKGPYSAHDVPCNTSDPEAVAVCLKGMGLEPILRRLPKTTTRSSPDDDAWKATLFARLDRIRLGCGTLCQLNTRSDMKTYTEANSMGTLPLVRVPDVDCATLLGMEDIDAGMDGNISEAKLFPDELNDFYTIGGSCPLRNKWLRSDVYLGKEGFTSVWTKEDIESDMAQLAKGTLRGTYGNINTNRLRDKLLAFNLTNKSVLVIGSERPWVEVICLYAGARHVTTLEYGKIESQHPQISTLTPAEFRTKYRNTLVRGAGRDGIVDDDLFFDGIVSHSSLEHSGLGRYGDAFNPWGDILAVARAWCVTKDDPSSFMFLGVPTGKDLVVSNWHRIYGEVRWPLLAANWRHVDHTDPSELERNEGASGGGGGLTYHFEKVVP